MKSKTVPILYAPGTYGTYLEWVLTTLTNDNDIVDPLTDSGSSHNFAGNCLENIEGWRAYLNSPAEYQFVRLHPRSLKDKSLIENLNEISRDVEHFIFVSPTDNTLLACLSNQFTKIWSSWWVQSFENHSELKKHIYNNWPMDPTADINSTPRWVQREFLSFYLMPMWHDQTGWWEREKFNDPKCTVFYVDELLFDFENSIKKLSSNLNLKLTKSILDLVPYHNKMLSSQKNLGIDQLCKQMIDSVINDVPMTWQSLSIVEESWLQWELRNLGYEIRCHGLDNFPVDSVKLKELLYKVKYESI